MTDNDYTNVNELHIMEGNAPQNSRIVGIDPTCNVQGTTSFANNRLFACNPWPKIVSNNGKIAMTESRVVGDKFLPLHTYTFKLPPFTEFEDVQISSQGDKAAWLLTYDRPETMSKLLHRIIPSTKVRTRLVQTLWVSRIDGREMHEVGHLYPRNDKEVVDGVKWTPSGAKLSFTYQDALWTVPAGD